MMLDRQDLIQIIHEKIGEYFGVHESKVCVAITEAVLEAVKEKTK